MLLKKSTGEDLSLSEALDGKPTVLILFRGSWCLYCMKHLKDIQAKYTDIQTAGYQLIAVSPDRPSNVADMMKRFNFPFLTLSDSPMLLAQALGTHVKVNKETRELYKSYNIDLEEASGLNHYLLPYPSIYLINPNGNITFSHVNEDYTLRMSAEHLLKELNK